MNLLVAWRAHPERYDEDVLQAELEGRPKPHHTTHETERQCHKRCDDGT